MASNGSMDTRWLFCVDLRALVVVVMFWEVVMIPLLDTVMLPMLMISSVLVCTATNTRGWISVPPATGPPVTTLLGTITLRVNRSVRGGGPGGGDVWCDTTDIQRESNCAA